MRLKILFSAMDDLYEPGYSMKNKVKGWGIISLIQYSLTLIH
jgi:hypothetical protein